MKTLSLSLALSISALAMAADSLVRLDLNTGRVSVLGATPIYTLEGVLGTKVNVNLSGFAGFRVSESGELLGGLAVTTPFQAAKNLVVDVGAALTFEQNKRPAIALVLGWRT